MHDMHEAAAAVQMDHAGPIDLHGRVRGTQQCRQDQGALATRLRSSTSGGEIPNARLNAVLKYDAFENPHCVDMSVIVTLGADALSNNSRARCRRALFMMVQAHILRKTCGVREQYKNCGLNAGWFCGPL